MRQLESISKTFDVSRPIFRLTIDSSGDSIDINVSEPVHRYRPIAEEGNILEELVVSHYKESFAIKEGIFQVNSESIAVEAMNEIRDSFRKFLERNMEMKNPRQSKLYKWTYSMPNTTDFNDTLVMVYKYIRSFTNEDMRFTIGNLDHVGNAIALLTAMEEKYSE